MHRCLLIASTLAVGIATRSASAESSSESAALDTIEADVGSEPLEVDASDAGASAGRPSVAFEARFGTGSAFPIVPRPLASTLEEAGHDPIAPASPRIDGYLGLVAGRFSFGLDLGASLGASTTPDHRLSAGRFFGSIGVRAYDGDVFGIAPNVGFGFMTQSLCFHRPGRQAASPRDPAFRQLVQSPGPQTCVRSHGPALRSGLAFDADLLFREGDGSIGGLRFRLEPGIEVPLQGGTWHGGPPAVEVMQGPSGPPIHAYLAVSIGVLVGR